jgi:feruloyl-CoA synthase
MARNTGVPLTLFAPPSVSLEPAGSTGRAGDLLIRSTEPLASHPVTVLHSLRWHARADPRHPLVAERLPEPGAGWRCLSYGDAATAAAAIGQALLDLGLGPGRPLLILSGNSVDHLLMTLGAMTAGIPVAPASVAYSLQSRDHGRIRAIAELIRPGAVFAEEAGRFGPALDAVGGIPAVVSAGDRPGALPLRELLAAGPGAAVEAAFAAIEPGTVAKILFTSGSTGTPKGVVNTHRMLAANQQMIRQAWPFLAGERPVIVDWLPWSHTFGGNHNLNMMLANGGTLYIDGGRPAPGLFGQTNAKLPDVPPSIYFNVPAGYGQLVPALEDDPAFAERFFSRLRLAFNAAAALPEALRDRLGAVAERTTGRRIPVTGSWGATETAPAVTSAHYEFADARCIGVPLPGAQVKLAVTEDGYEIRVKGPMVTPGYFGQPDLTAAAFDSGGYFRTGDAVTLADPADPAAGLLFRGRVAEDFKLDTGTFVRVGAVRTALLSAVPLLSDTVLAGENRGYVSALAWLNGAEARKVLGEDPGPDGELVINERLRTHLARALAGHNSTAGSASRVERLVLLALPASLDLGEITDKGYVNQRKVLAQRARLVELLYADPVPDGVIVAGKTA